MASLFGFRCNVPDLAVACTHNVLSAVAAVNQHLQVLDHACGMDAGDAWLVQDATALRRLCVALQRVADSATAMSLALSAQLQVSNIFMHLLRQLDSALAVHGLWRHNGFDYVPGDCMFDAVSLLMHENGQILSSRQLRGLVADRLSV